MLDLVTTYIKISHMRETDRQRDEPWMRSGFCEEAEDPIARTDKETLSGFFKAREANKRGLDLKPNSSWVFEEM